ncbi:MAG TPA: hypothetical protein VFK14_12435 [Solirubrobacterales bacterium]|nr:hypothetical protein [Solirubrobacterales bacterium]
MDDPYITVGPDPSGDPDSHYVAADQLALGRLRESETVAGEWMLSSVSPAIFSPVSFIANDLDDAKSKAIAWLDKHLRTERPDLLGDDD